MIPALSNYPTRLSYTLSLFMSATCLSSACLWSLRGQVAPGRLSRGSWPSGFGEYPPGYNLP
jgi:hypothetical protein